MPFDGAISSGLAQEVLEAAAAAGGIRPIDRAFLEAHKADQLRRHPAGWAYRHAGLIQVLQAAMLLGGFGAFHLLSASGRPDGGGAAGMTLFALAVLSTFVPVRGPALWRESSEVDLRAVPGPVREAALRLQEQLPEVRFALGELFQDRVRLDPYLVAEHRGARIVLGIWDDDALIACA